VAHSASLKAGRLRGKRAGLSPRPGPLGVARGRLSRRPSRAGLFLTRAVGTSSLDLAYYVEASGFAIGEQEFVDLVGVVSGFVVVFDELRFVVAQRQ
jgi:hypothetical protein